MAADKKSPVPKTIAWRRTGDEAVILDLRTSEYYSANGTGTFVWELLAAGRRPAKIAEALAAEYGIPPAQAAADVAAFIEDLSRLKILSPEAAE